MKIHNNGNKGLDQIPPSKEITVDNCRRITINPTLSTMHGRIFILSKVIKHITDVNENHLQSQTI